MRRAGRAGLLPCIPEFGRYLGRRWADDPPDVVHAHSWTSGLAALQGSEQAARRSGAPRVPVVQTYHVLGTVRPRHQGRDGTGRSERLRLERAIGRGPDAVIATCSDELEELAAMGVRRDRITIVPCGVDLDRFSPGGPALPRPDGARRLVVLSRLVERKGVDTAIGALARVPNAELLVGGGPPRRDLDADPEVRRLRDVAAAAGVPDRVRFLGRVGRPDVPALLRSADLVVTLPWYERFGLVPLEAMACGVPVVASGVGGHLDTVVEGVTGVHLPARAPHRAAERIRGLLGDRALCLGMGVASADRARSRYSWERVAHETVAVYARAATNGEGPVRATAEPGRPRAARPRR